jgi:hypothetical protein
MQALIGSHQALLGWRRQVDDYGRASSHKTAALSAMASIVRTAMKPWPDSQPSANSPAPRRRWPAACCLEEQKQRQAQHPERHATAVVPETWPDETLPRDSQKGNLSVITILPAPP